MLTPRETDLLNYIIDFKRRNGYAPTVREMCRGINTHSMQHIKSMLERLQDKGYIDYKSKKARTIKINKGP